MKGPDGIALF